MAISTIPILKGVGVAQQIGTTCVVTYYCSLIALVLFFLSKSFVAQLPWSTCWEKWETLGVQCVSATSNVTVQPGAKSSSELYFM